MAEERGAGFEVTRFIPVPKSVSDHAQQFLAMGFSIGGDGSQKEPALDDIESLARNDQDGRRRVDRGHRDAAASTRRSSRPALATCFCPTRCGCIDGSVRPVSTPNCMCSRRCRTAAFWGAPEDSLAREARSSFLEECGHAFDLIG